MDLSLPIIQNLLKNENCSQLIVEHHIEGLLYHLIQAQELQLITKNQYKKQWIHNQILLSEIVELSKATQRYKNSAIILKGSHLLLDLYSDIGQRFLSDIDLLISHNEIKHWQEILEKNGYTKIKQKTFYANNFKEEWIKIIEEIEVNIELHTKLFFHSPLEDWKIVSTDFININKLSNEDLFLHLCGHLAFQHTFLKLYWLFDIYLFYIKNSKNIDWNYLYNKSQKLKLFRSVQMCLWILATYFNVTIDTSTANLFRIKENQWWKKILTVEFLIDPLKSKWKYLVIKHATKDHLISAFRYDLAWFFHYKIQNILLKK